MMTLSSLQTLAPAQVPGLPCRAGLGLKNEHFAEVLETSPDIGFLKCTPKTTWWPAGRFITTWV